MKSHPRERVNHRRWPRAPGPSPAGPGPGVHKVEQQAGGDPAYGLRRSSGTAKGGRMTTMYEHVGGEEALRRLAEHFHHTVLEDPLLGELFRAGSPYHADHFTAFLTEMLGGPARYTDELGGFIALLRAHAGMRITPEQSDRFVSLLLRAADEVALPDDDRFRKAFTANVEKAAGFTTKASQEDDHPMLQPPYPVLGRWKW
ncbi:group II truncated hemoglobin [Streptomyces sp. SPB074]|uniref:group II truncated hemoglobin n=1 Tax=Streptomyces sp. (strain SPB074) TaxID=465543 RepID=UPI00131A1F29|nr:group II truncated hemoglobin [Streptomyces sp. SPB074]